MTTTQPRANMVSVHQPQRAIGRLSGASRSAIFADKRLPPRPDESTARILVGPKKHSFKVNCLLLCRASPFFRERLEDPFHSRTASLWLPNESPPMFALFVDWVHHPRQFKAHVAHAVHAARGGGDEAALEDIHWAIIHLHLFAADLSLWELKDLAMDAIQHLYRKCRRPVTPRLITYLYTECEAKPSRHLRRWATATLALAERDLSRFHRLFESKPEFGEDYARYMTSMTDVAGHYRLQNGQPTFGGFHGCAFHSHHPVVDGDSCPNSPAEPPCETRSVDLDAPRSKWSLSSRRWNATLFSRGGTGAGAGNPVAGKRPSITQSIAKTFRGKGA